MEFKNIRIKKGLTQIELAKKAGVALRSLQMYESGKRVPDARTAILIAKALRTTVEKLWGGNPTIT